MVTTSTYNGVVCFDYKGLYISRDFWEDAPFPISCKKITDYTMEKLVVDLYDELVDTFGLIRTKRYIEEDYTLGNDGDIISWDDIDDYRMKYEESLFLNNGGEYYEDLEENE